MVTNDIYTMPGITLIISYKISHFVLTATLESKCLLLDYIFVNWGLESYFSKNINLYMNWDLLLSSNIDSIRWKQKQQLDFQ